MAVCLTRSMFFTSNQISTTVERSSRACFFVSSVSVPAVGYRDVHDTACEIIVRLPLQKSAIKRHIIDHKYKCRRVMYFSHFHWWLWSSHRAVKSLTLIFWAAFFYSFHLYDLPINLNSTEGDFVDRWLQEEICGEPSTWCGLSHSQKSHQTRLQRFTVVYSMFFSHCFTPFFSALLIISCAFWSRDKEAKNKVEALRSPCYRCSCTTCAHTVVSLWVIWFKCPELVTVFVYRTEAFA